jgi:Protein of unknown function (DUF2934)
MAPSTATEKQKTEPTEDEIRKRAYEIHVEHGGLWGNDVGDWFQAERELREKYKNNGK